MGIMRLDAISKIYGNGLSAVKALNEINLNIEAGEFVAIIGESGSGKSTLLSLMAGLDKPTDGEITYNGVRFFTLNPTKLADLKKKEIGVIYQFYNLIPSLNVRENITLPVLLDNKDVDENVLDEILEKFKLKDRENFYIHDLSGGQMQKVAVARALMNKPTMILADEPTGNLDSISTNEVINLFKKENQENGTTIVIVTHNLEIAKICSRVITLSDGKIIDDTKNNKEL